MNETKSDNSNMRHSCHPTNKYKDICVSSDKGKYRTRQSCMNDCETRYINTHLITAKLKAETNKFNDFIIELNQKEKMSVYLKGGTVLGLKILSMIYSRYGRDLTQFKKIFRKFIKLNLVRDWDFTGYTRKEITPEYHTKLDKIAKKYKLALRAKTFILYQTQYPILLYDQVLFEISILFGEVYSNLELPMTTMKIWMNRQNINHIFMLAKSFYSYYTQLEKARTNANTKTHTGSSTDSSASPSPSPRQLSESEIDDIIDSNFDLDMVIHIVKDLKFLIYPHKQGLFKLAPEMLDMGNLSDELIEFTEEFARGDNNLMQFLLTQFKDPGRIFYRLPEKNFPKTEKISKFLLENNIVDTLPHWLINPKYINNIIKIFIDKLSVKTSNIFTDALKKQDYSFALEQVANFFTDVNFARIEIDYENIQEAGYTLIKKLFKPLIRPEIIDIPSKKPNLPDQTDKDKLINMLKFLHKQNII
jgi:hypothetical protein